MERRAKDSTLVGFGAASIHLERAALCCEESCEVIFDIASARGGRTADCPGCGGASWLPLSTIVPSLRIAPAGMMVVPAKRIRA